MGGSEVGRKGGSECGSEGVSQRVRVQVSRGEREGAWVGIRRAARDMAGERGEEGKRTLGFII